MPNFCQDSAQTTNLLVSKLQPKVHKILVVSILFPAGKQITYSSEMMKSAVLLLLLQATSVFFQDATAQGLQLHIMPNSDQECNVSNSSSSMEVSCMTLSELVTNTSSYLSAAQAPITLIFLSGQHQMPSNGTLIFANIADVKLRGERRDDDSAMPEIQCQNHNGAFIFRDVDKVSITNLRFENCGSSSTDQRVTGNRLTMFMQKATLFASNIADLVLDSIIVMNGRGYGLYGLNVKGNSSISNSEFIDNKDGGGIYLEYVDFEPSFFVKTYSFTVKNTILRGGLHERGSSIGSGISVKLSQHSYSMRFHLVGSTIRDNVARISPSIRFESSSTQLNFIRVEDCRCSNGTVTYATAGGSGFQYVHIAFPFLFPLSLSPVPAGKTEIEILNSYFFESYGVENPTLLSELTSSVLSFAMILSEESVSHSFLIRDSSIFNNGGSEGAAIFAQTVGLRDRTIVASKVSFEFTRTVIANNTCTILIPERLTTIFLSNVGNVTFTNNTIVNNFGTGVTLEFTNAYISGWNRIENNTAHNGGGIALYGDSILYFEPHTILLVVGNRVDNVGGGIYVGRTVEHVSVSQCFFDFYNADNYLQSIHFDVPVSLHMYNNSAGLAGNDVYGGSLDTCHILGTSTMGADILMKITNVDIDVTTKPSRVCLCNETDGTKDCTELNRTITAYPGQRFTLSAITVGQYLRTSDPRGTPSAIYASILQNNEVSEQGSLPSVYLAQQGGRTCTNITYSVHSRNKYEFIVLTIENGNQLAPYNKRLLDKAVWWRENLDTVLPYFVSLPVYISVEMKECPLGFEISNEDTCDCAAALVPLGINCSINENTIHRPAPLWIGTENQMPPTSSSDNDEASKIVYLMHRHCPFDFCKPGDIDFDLKDADMQCAFNRSGVLCGGCKPHLSAILGGSQCRKCSNVFNSLLFLFLLAGVLLVVFLVATNLTVSIGTINGLIFFANIVKEHQAVFFPRDIGTNILTVFIAWLNLDFGFNVCLFDGMTAYAKAWLQFLFPLYIWLLAVLIIMASRYSDRIAKLCGKNIVQVLATLFLLSYAKLQRTITTGLAFTILDLSNNQTRLVWLYDGNIVYLQGIHIPLFVACVTALLFLFVPYTLVILFGRYLQAKSHYKIFFWVGRLKPIFDAYLGPYKDQYRYWTGILLLARIMVLLLSAGNVLGDASINLVAIAIICYILVALVLLSGGVYKKWPISALECFFYVNLGVLATVTLYNRLSGGSQLVVIYLSLSVAFTAFCGILIYHIFIIRLDLANNKHCKLLLSKITHGKRKEGKVLGAVNELADSDIFDHRSLSISGKEGGEKPLHKSSIDVTTIEISIIENRLRDSILEEDDDAT